MTQFSLGALLREHQHLSTCEIDQYILETLSRESRHAVEVHLKSCPECKKEVDFLHRVINDTTCEDEIEETKEVINNACSSTRFVWADESKMWIDELQYPLIRIAEKTATVRVFGLTHASLYVMRQADQESKGKHIVSIESGDIELTFPLSELTEAQMALAAGSVVGYGPSHQGGFSHKDGREFQYKDKNLTLDFLVDSVGNVFLSAHLPANLSA